jgi:IPT/TIG domain-containing protein
MSSPMISSITPSSGPPGGGTQVTIAGSGLSSVNEADDILFGSEFASRIVSITDSEVVVITPPASAIGDVDVTLSTVNGFVNITNGFDYMISIDSIYPASGPVAGGTTLTITGSGLLHVTGIEFNDTAATSMTITSDTQLTVVTPPATVASSVDVTFLGPAGTGVYFEMGGYNYVAAAAAPASGGSTAASPTAAPAADPPATDPNAAAKNPAKDASANNPATADPKTAAPPKTPAAPAPDPPTDAAPPAAKAPAAAKDPTAKDPAASGTPTPSGDYIPGGRMLAPDGKTGLGGTDGSAQGFGVGTLMAGGGGSAAASNLSSYVDPGLTGQLVQSLITLVSNATSPDALEAQNMILRRMALQGDVIGSRIPPPRNISEIGGYINLLSTLNENTMRQQALAGILGVAGPAQPLGWISNNQPLSMVAVSNDRPAVAAQASFPLTTLVRSDFVSSVQTALKTLHAYGATLPLTSPSVIQLPLGGTGATIPQPILFYIGRMLTIAPSAGLRNPAADPIAVLAPTGIFTDYFLASHVLNAAVFATPAADLQAVQCTPTSSAIVLLSQVEFVPITPVLAAAGYYSASPFPVPASTAQTAWATFTNTTGLVSGVTKLGDELNLLYRQDLIAGSAFAAMLNWTWNGTAFAA